MKGEKKMEENVMIVPDEEIGVDELEENLTGEVEQQQAEENDELVAALRQGLGELFEDGWTTGELDAMTQDEGVKREIASGHGVVRAACGYLKRMLETAAARKGNVPIADDGGGRGAVGQRHRADERQGVRGIFSGLRKR
ncbi:MAG: hypothetical protein ACLSIR_11690 [Christensenellales bacterium]